MIPFAVALLLAIQQPGGKELIAAADASLNKDREGARRLYQQAASMCEAAADFQCAGNAYNQLGLMAFFDGVAGGVAEWYGKAVVAFERAGLPKDQATAIR